MFGLIHRTLLNWKNNRLLLNILRKNLAKSQSLYYNSTLLPYDENTEFILEEYNRNGTRNRFGRCAEICRPNHEQEKQTDMIADHIYGKYDVFKRFKPLAVGIDQDLVAALPQYDPALIARVLANHCRRPRYLKALARGGKRFDLNNRFKGEVSAEEQTIANSTQPFNRHWLHKPNAKLLRLLQKQKAAPVQAETNEAAE